VVRYGESLAKRKNAWQLSYHARHSFWITLVRKRNSKKKKNAKKDVHGGKRVFGENRPPSSRRSPGYFERAQWEPGSAKEDEEKKRPPSFDTNAVH